jgi:hypothetical protein
MSMIYPEEAWAIYGPSVQVQDATGRTLERVAACNPVTGEVVRVLADTHPSVPFVAPYCLLMRWLRKRFGVHGCGSYPTTHYFAPAPLVLSARVADSCDPC